MVSFGNVIGLLEELQESNDNEFEVEDRNLKFSYTKYFLRYLYNKSIVIDSRVVERIKVAKVISNDLLVIVVNNLKRYQVFLLTIKVNSNIDNCFLAKR